MIWLFFSVIVAVVTADLITKFTIDGVMNSGIAWGLGAQLPWLWVFVVVFSFVLVAVLLWWFFSRKKRTWFWTISLALFIGGVLGNAIDRLLSNGAVHDFIDFIIFRNNLADIALSVGAVMMVLAMIMEEFRAPR